MSKIKLVPCPNISKRELMTALMDGRKFTTDKELHDSPVSYGDIHWDDNFGDSPVRQGTERWNWRGFKYLHEITEQQWYEDPDMIGKPVKVKDRKDHNWQFRAFLSVVIYDNNEVGYLTKHNDYEWAHCEPLTAADLYQEQV